MTITELLFSMRDTAYRDFSAKLMPTVDKSTVIGVRVSDLRKTAKKLDAKDAAEFMKALPHRYYEENNLHAFLIAGIKDFNSCIAELDRFLPFVDNWATCDGMNPKVLRNEPERLLIKIKEWLHSEHTYTVRFAVKCLMDFYLDKNFNKEILTLVASLKSEEYYINMCSAWFFATALAKRPDDTLPFFSDKRLDKWVHNKAISKARESFRVDDKMKKLLGEMRIK